MCTGLTKISLDKDKSDLLPVLHNKTEHPATRHPSGQ